MKSIQLSKSLNGISSVFAAVIAAVFLPQVLHYAGSALGIGTGLGEMFLPMQFPVLLAGFLAGPCVGVIAGLLSPVFSTLISGMPVVTMLPYITIELMVYGLVAGLMRNKAGNDIGKLLITQISGRAARSAAVLFAVFILNQSGIPVQMSWTYITVGIWGIVLQALFIPLLLKIAERNRKC